MNCIKRLFKFFQSKIFKRKYKKTSFINCSMCPYYNTNNSNSCLPIGLEHSFLNKKLLVFQAPGIDEWKGVTISGKRTPLDSSNKNSAANKMRNSFNRNKVLRYYYDITDAVQCYPGKLKNNRDKKPSIKAQRICEYYLKNDIIKKKYREIVCFGNIAYKMVNKIVIENNLKGVKTTPAVHPSRGVTRQKLDSSY